MLKPGPVALDRLSVVVPTLVPVAKPLTPVTASDLSKPLVVYVLVCNVDV